MNAIKNSHLLGKFVSHVLKYSYPDHIIKGERKIRSRTGKLLILKFWVVPWFYGRKITLTESQNLMCDCTC